eukprot:RCo012906
MAFSGGHPSSSSSSSSSSGPRPCTFPEALLGALPRVLLFLELREQQRCREVSEGWADAVAAPPFPVVPHHPIARAAAVRLFGFFAKLGLPQYCRSFYDRGCTSGWALRRLLLSPTALAELVPDSGHRRKLTDAASGLPTVAPPGQVALEHDALDLYRSPIEEILLAPDSEFDWYAELTGPTGTPYSGGSYQIRLRFPHEYPLKPPQVQFLSKIYHPNVNPGTGVLTATLLEPGRGWNPSLNL